VVLDPALTLLNTSSEQRKFEIFHDGLATLVYYSPSSVSIEMIKNITKEKNSERIWNEKVTLVAITELPQGASSTVGSKRYISPKQIVQDLTKRGLRHIMVEGGE
jgi:riboflavin biosynthesis pyrimidine reductase